jgi:MtN3 and saliva related transmembrane protein
MLSGLAPMIGLIAGVYGCAFAFAPLLQIRKTLMTGAVEQVSVGLFAGGMLNGVLWLAYGVSVGSLPVVAANILGITTCTATVIVMHRIRSRGAARRPAVT